MTICDPVQPLPEEGNPPVLAPTGRETACLVLYRGVKPTRTSLRETDAVSATRRGLAEYLGTRTVQVAGALVQFKRSLEVWSDSETPADYPACVVQIASPAQFDASSFTPNVDPTDKLPTGEVLVKQSEVTVSLTVEAHCSTPGQRRAVAVLLEDALNPVDWMHGFRLDLPFYFGERCEYEVISADFRDDATEARHELRPLLIELQARISQVRARDLPQMRPSVAASVGLAPTNEQHNPIAANPSRR